MLKYANYDVVCQEIPDELTFAINLTGCPNHCPGCHSPWLWEDSGTSLSVDELRRVLAPYDELVTCVCFMGGDGDPASVELLAQWLKQKYPTLKIAWYSGREVLPDGFNYKLFNYLKLGPYRKDRGGLRAPDTNQQLFKVTSEGNLDPLSLVC